MCIYIYIYIYIRIHIHIHVHISYTYLWPQMLDGTSTSRVRWQRPTITEYSMI